MPRLVHIISLKSSPDELLLRGVAIDTIGAVAEAVGKDMFRPHVESLMSLALEGMQLESSRLRECSYCFYSILARVFEDEFAPYLPTIMPHLIASCQAEEKDDFALEGEIDLTTDTFEDEEETLGGFNFNSAIADEKEIAADALGELFENTRSHFLPYVEQSMTELVQLSDHISEGVRKAVVGSLFNFLKTFSRMSNPPPFEPGLPLVCKRFIFWGHHDKCTRHRDELTTKIIVFMFFFFFEQKYKVHDNVASMIHVVMPAVIKMWSQEDDM